MEVAAHLLRYLAIVVTPFAVVQVFGPLADAGEWLRVATNPDLSFRGGTGAAQLFAICRGLTVSVALLGVPALFWLFAGLADRQATRDGDDAPS